MERDTGKRYGSRIAPVDAGLDGTRARFAVEVQRVVTRTNSRLAARRHLANLTEERAVAAESKLAELREDFKGVRQWRSEFPGDFDAVRGALYVFISAALIVSDVSLLGRVLAGFLDITYVDKDSQQTFLQTLFSSPTQLLARHAELSALTLGLLIIGLFMKVWRDVHRSGPRTDSHSHVRRWERWVVSALFVLTVACIVSVAYARMEVPIGTGQGGASTSAGSFVTLSIGLALPFVGAGFFIRGYDCLFQRYTFRRLLREIGRVETEVDRLRTAASKVFEELVQLEGRKTRFEAASYLDQLLLVRQDEFVDGYREGLLAALSAAPGSLYRTLKPLAAQRTVLEAVGL